MATIRAVQSGRMGRGGGGLRYQGKIVMKGIVLRS